MANPGERPTLTIARRDPFADINWDGGLPPFQLQWAGDLGQWDHVSSWVNMGNPTLARGKEIELTGDSGYYRVQSEFPQLDVDLTGGQTRLFWTVPDLPESASRVPDIYPWPFPGVKPEGWREWMGGNHPATWDYTANPIEWNQSIGFSVPTVNGADPQINPYAVGADYTFPKAYNEFYVTFLFKTMSDPYRATEVCDLYDAQNEMCNVYLYPPGGQYAGGLALFMRDGYGGVTSPIPVGQTIRIWIHYKVTPEGSVSDLAWALPNKPRPTSGPQFVGGGNSLVGGGIVKLLFGPVDTGITFVYAGLEAATFPLHVAPSTPDSIDHFRLSRRVPEGPWEILNNNIGPTVREYLDTDVPEPVFEYMLRGYTTLGEEWDYSPVVRVEETSHAVFKWQKKIQGTAGNSDNNANSIAVGADGSSVITGYFATNANFGDGVVNTAGSYDIFVVKHAPDGSFLWARPIGAVDNDQARAVAIDSSGDVYIHGYFQSQNLSFGPGFGPYSAQGSDVFLLKLDGITGNTLWVKVFTGAGIEQAFGITVDSEDNPIICGNFGINGGSIDLGFGVVFSQHSWGDSYVAKYSPNGSPMWAKTFGGPHPSSVTTDPDDNSVIVTGQFMGTMTVGSETLTSAGGADIFLIRWSANGDQQWARRFGSPHNDSGAGVAVGSNGSILLVGNFSDTVDFGNGITLTFHGASDMFVASFDKHGLCQWANGWGSQFGGDSLQNVTRTPGNVFVMTGWISSFIDMGGGYLPAIGGQDVLLAKFDLGGNHVWSRRYGGFGYDYGRGVATGVDGNIYACGTFASSIDFGGGAMNSGGQMLTSYLVKLGS